MSVSNPTMARLLGRLSAAMGKPFTDAKIEAQASEYARAMGNLPDYAVEWAVERAIRESDKYPKAATLRKLAQECPHLLNGNHDQSLRSQMVRWEADPWEGIASLDQDRTQCRSTPCPVCASVIVFSDRGMVVVHDGRLHREAQAGYSNLGRPEWLTMGPMPELPARRSRPTPTLYFRTLEDSQRQPVPLAAILPPLPVAADEGWDAEQQERATQERIA